ncbi:MAG: FAD-dependent oxidoreductase [Candidatus Nitrosocaldaceae archaeon]
MIYNIQVPIIERKAINNEIVEVGFDLLNNEFAFKAGQYIKLELNLLYDDPKGNVREFNIISSPTSRKLSLAFKLSDSGFKRTLCKITKGTLVSIRGPFGNFILPTYDAEIKMVAHGIGITPCLSIIRYASEMRLGYKITLFYFNDGYELPYINELRMLEKINKRFKVDTSCSLKDADAFGLWYVSGARKNVRELLNILYKKGVRDSQFVVEEFTGY